MSDPRKRDSSWIMFKPGLYIDPEGYGHIFPDEILATLQCLHPEMGFNFSKADYDLVVRVFLAELRAARPDVKVRIIQHEREKAS